VGEKERGNVRRAALVLAGCGALLLAAWVLLIRPAGDAPDDLGATPDRTPATPAKIRIALDEYPNAWHAFIFAAEEMGFLREQGVALEPVVAGAGRDPLRMLDEGKADLALASQPDVLLARNEGRPVVSVAAIVPRPLVYLMVPKDSPIHAPAHLAGRTVALSGSPVHEAMLGTMLDSVPGGRPAAEMVTAEVPVAGMLLDGRADALLGPDIVDGKERLEQAGLELRLIEPMLYGVPFYYEKVLAAEERALAENRDLFGRVWTALARGFEYVEQHPAEAARRLAGAGVFDGNPSWTVSLEQLDERLPFMRADAGPFGVQDGKAWKETEKWLAGRALIDPSLNADDAFLDLAAEDGDR